MTTNEYYEMDLALVEAALAKVLCDEMRLRNKELAARENQATYDQWKLEKAEIDSIISELSSLTDYMGNPVAWLESKLVTPEEILSEQVWIDSFIKPKK